MSSTYGAVTVPMRDGVEPADVLFRSSGPGITASATPTSPEPTSGRPPSGPAADLTGERLPVGEPVHQDVAPVKLFVMGINQWRDEQSWPLPGAVATAYHLGGDASAAAGTRSTTAPVTSAISGYATVTLVDVHPDGTALNVCDGILRCRYRDGLDKPTPVAPGEVYEIEANMTATSLVFFAGHRIRVGISSSDYPRFDRNTNMGGFIAREPVEAAIVAHNAVHVGPVHPSRIILPIVER